MAQLLTFEFSVFLSKNFSNGLWSHLAKPRNWVPQSHETLPEIPHDTAFLCSPADVPGPRKVQLRIC